MAPTVPPTIDHPPDDIDREGVEELVSVWVDVFDWVVSAVGVSVEGLRIFDDPWEFVGCYEPSRFWVVVSRSEVVEPRDAAQGSIDRGLFQPFDCFELLILVHVFCLQLARRSLPLFVSRDSVAFTWFCRPARNSDRSINPKVRD